MLGLIAIGPSRLSQNAAEDSDDSSSRHRVDLWSEGLEMFKDNPVLGVGKGQFVGYTGTQVAHNAFIENLGETGLSGRVPLGGLDLPLVQEPAPSDAQLDRAEPAA